MLDFPNAKINIGLNILRKRTDGYHDIETLLYPIPLWDILEFVPCSSTVNNSEPTLINTGIILPGPVENNLCYKAWQRVKSRYSIPPIKIHLHKAIPPGSGLGGGSANASFMIKMLSTFFQLEISLQEMEVMAGKLGSDCPFFIRNQPAFATARGEILSSAPPILSGYHMAIIYPGIHIDTGRAYARIEPAVPGISLKESITLPVNEWRHVIRNDFETIVFTDHPEIGQLKKMFYEAGALYSSLSGSGSAVYGIFDREINMRDIPAEYFCWQSNV
jgi:4-diphosphocytidyl-2-C-methyl-D-erythritol kinase